MATEQDEALYWAGKAADAHHNAQDIVQASAGKWQAAIAAFLGACQGGQEHGGKQGNDRNHDE